MKDCWGGRIWRLRRQLFEGQPFQFRAPFGARTFSPLWTDLLQSFTPSVACIPAGKLLQICLLQSVIKWYSGEMVPRGTPPPTRQALAHRSRSFSVPRSLCGAVQITALSGSFGHLCVSRNACVTGFALRGHQVIYAKSPTAHIRYSLFPSQYSPSTGQALAHRSRSRKGQSPKSAVIRGLHNNMPPTTSAHNPFAANLHQVARLKLLGSVCLKSSMSHFSAVI